jgi:hypothetical protein
LNRILAITILAFASLAYASPATRLEFASGPQSIPEGSCAAIGIVSENGSLKPAPVIAATKIAASGNGLSFYTDVACSVKGGTVTIPAGQSTGNIYVKGTAEGTFVISISVSSGPNLAADAEKEYIVAPLPPACTGEASAPSTPPSPAENAGLSNLAFDDEFNTLDVNWSTNGGTGSNWYAWNPDGPALTSSQVSLANGCLTINTSQNTYSYGISTINSLTPSSGTWHVPFYFEARMQTNPQGWTSSGEGWPAFWSYSIEALNNVFPSTELDVTEFYPGGPGGATPALSKGVYELNTIHQWSSSSANEQNTPDNPALPSFNYSAFHIYGVLATSTAVTWYIDNVEVLSVPVGQGTNFTTLAQDEMPLIIGTGKNWPATFDYVHVWQ